MPAKLEHFALLASVYDEQKPLPGVPAEAVNVNTVINRRNGWLCSNYQRVTLGQIQEAFTKKETPFQIFHFAGHAFEEKLQLNDNLALIATCLVFPEGLAQSLRRFHPVELVFLNGCSTARQVGYFLDSGAKAVIATHRPLKDEYGVVFSAWFYFFLFNRGLSLRDAFDQALETLTTTKGAYTTDWLNLDLKKALHDRGFDLDDDEDPQKPVYELFLHPNHPDFVAKTLDEWPVPEQTSAGRAAISERELLRCDRVDEDDTFRMVVEEMAGASPKQPVFFFVHEFEDACPLLLTDRFENIALPELDKKEREKKVRFKWEKWELPERPYWKDRKTCLKRLSGIYATRFDATYQEGLGRHVFNQPLPEEEILLINHDLNFNQIEWQDSLEILMEVYLDEFGKILADELTPRMAVLFSVEYFEPDSPFGELFNRLAAKPRASQLHNFTRLPLITRTHLGNWVRRVFGDGEGAPTLDDFALRIAPQAWDDQKKGCSMKAARQALLAGLRDYNNPPKILQP